MDILIIDDNAAVRRSFARVLEREGFTVGEVENGLAALGVLRDHGPRVVLCDIHMAFLEGKSFFHELRDLYPDVAQRVIFATGFADEPDIQTFLDDAGQPVLRKPVERAALLAAVRATIDSERVPTE